MTSTLRSYNLVAWLYETTAGWYSLGRIGKSKAWQVQYLKPGDKVLYAGAGAGEDAMLAAQAGAAVTCVDTASKMLQRAQRRIEAEGFTAEYIHADVNDVAADGSYDAVAANYFFTSFDTEGEMVGVMDHLVGLLKPGGKLMIADWAPQRGTGWRRVVQKTHKAVGNGLYWLIGLAYLRPIREYPEYLQAAGLEMQHLEEFPLTRWGPNSFWSMVAQLPDAPSDP
ncbi:MAG: class I SAM-dependent methyltransferase [bacterium]|nr:class I SAM-dependent methyltransferase [bacterium]MCP4963826.1 class I SAM-dependent methyltransferase [bacterium]